MGLKVAIAKVISSAITETFRIAKAEIYPNYSKEARVFYPPGVDSVPVDGKDQGLTIEVGTSGKTAFVGVSPVPIAEVGEIRIYSRDEDGNLKASVHCKKNGDIEIVSDGGKIAIDNNAEKLKVLMNDLITQIKAITTTAPASISAGSQSALAAVSARFDALLKES